MRTETITLYMYDELSEQAKAKARDWYRGLLAEHDTLDCWREDILGILKGPMGGRNSDLAYSLGHCQGDGLSFTGTFTPTVAECGDCPELADLAAFAAEWPGLTFTLERQRDHYCHEHTVTLASATYGEDGDSVPEVHEPALTEVLRDLMTTWRDAGYAEQEDQQSDEAIADVLEVNDYEFTADRRRWRA